MKTENQGMGNRILISFSIFPLFQPVRRGGKELTLRDISQKNGSI